MLFATGCAATNTVTLDEYRDLQKDMQKCLYQTTKPAIAEAMAEEKAARGKLWDIPPYTWKPAVCTFRSHESTWPDYSDVPQTECIWYFHPLEEKGMCKAKWVLQDKKWSQASLHCLKYGSQRE